MRLKLSDRTKLILTGIAVSSIFFSASIFVQRNYNPGPGLFMYVVISGLAVFLHGYIAYGIVRRKIGERWLALVGVSLLAGFEAILGYLIFKEQILNGSIPALGYAPAWTILTATNMFVFEGPLRGKRFNETSRCA